MNSSFLGAGKGEEILVYKTRMCLRVRLGIWQTLGTGLGCATTCLEGLSQITVNLSVSIPIIMSAPTHCKHIMLLSPFSSVYIKCLLFFPNFYFIIILSPLYTHHFSLWILLTLHPLPNSSGYSCKYFV